MVTTIAATYSDVSYVPSAVTGHYNQVCNIFIPTTPMPHGGYPCFVFAHNSGFISTGNLDTIDEGSGFLFLLLKAGWVIISANTTVAGQTVTDGGAAITGKGFFKLMSSSMWASSAFLEKDGPLLVQFARYYATTYRINPNKVFIGGRSGGSCAAMAAALLPDFAAVGSAWGFYDGVSSRPNGVVARAYPRAWVDAIADGTSLSQTHCLQYASNTTTIADTYTTAATDFGTGGAGANVETRSQSSGMRFGFDRALQWYQNALETQQKQIDILNKTQKFYLYSPGDEVTVESVDFTYRSAEWDFSTNPANNPFAFDVTAAPLVAPPLLDTLTEAHSAWHMYAMREALKQIGVQWGVGGKRSRCATTPNIDNYVANNTPTKWTGVERKFPVAGHDSLDPQEIDIAEWLQEQIGFIVGGPTVAGVSVQDCTARINHWLHTEDSGAVSRRELVNDAQALVASMHRWRWLNRSTVGLDLIASQPWIDIPDDVGEIMAIESSDASAFETVNLTTLDDVLMRRGNIGSIGGYWASVVYSEPGPAGETPRPRLEIAPTPGATELNAFSMFYRARLLPVTDDWQQIPLPWYMIPLWWEVLRSVALGTYEEMNGTVSERMAKVMAGPVYELALQQDGRIQTTAGVMRGGILQGSHARWHSSATTLAAPS